MQKFYGIILLCVLWILGLGASTLFAQEEKKQNAFEEQKSHIMEEVYMNPDFLPLVDVDKAKEKLSWLAKSFQQLADQYYAWDDKKEELDNEYEDVYTTLEYILSDIKRKKKGIIKTLTKITFSKKKISEVKKSLQSLKVSIEQSKNDLSRYTLFLYKLNNDFYGQDDTISDIKLLVKSDNIAESLSSSNLVHMLTVKLEDLLIVLQQQQAKYTKQVMQLNKATLSYQTSARHLKKELDNLWQQKIHFNQLLSYLEVSRNEANAKIWTLRQSKEELEKQIARLKNITDSAWKPLVSPGTKAYNLLNIKDKEKGQRYFSRPIAPLYRINYFYHDEKYLKEYGEEYEGVDIDVEQGSEVYAPAPWIVYKIYNTDDINLNWMVIIHKYGYMTLYQPLSEIFVQPWDIVKRWQIIARTGWEPGTKGAWLASKKSHLSFEILQNGEPVDPYTLMDISIFPEEYLPQQYKIKYLNDYFAREVDLSILPKISWNTVEERRDNRLETYASWPYRNASLWYGASKDTEINPIFWLCIGYAETSYKHFKSKNNIWNVGNDDSGNTVEYDTPLSWVKALFNVLNNQYLWWYYTINELSRFGNADDYIYASSPYNWQKNVTKCMSTIYGYPVPEDFPFRIKK